MVQSGDPGMGCLDSFNVNLEVTAGAQEQKGHLPPFLPSHASSFLTRLVLAALLLGNHLPMLSFPQPHTKFPAFLIFSAPSLTTLHENMLSGEQDSLTWCGVLGKVLTIKKDRKWKCGFEKFILLHMKGQSSLWKTIG